MGIATGLGFLHAVILFNQGLIDVGNVITYMGFLGLFGFPVWTSLFAFSQVSLGLAAGRRIFALITARTDLDANRSGHAAPIKGNVRFDNVTFQHPGAAQPALSRVSFEALPGQVIAIVGQTGSGKSTLARLINRTFDPQIGRVIVDGLDVRGWQLEALRSQVSIIEQDIFLFSRTIGENIAFGKPDAKWPEIEAAARAAQAHDFIMSFKDGYDTVVGSRGVTLSGGQRQRIALARAFLTDPRILILDDSTSAIDSATEDQIQRAIFQATRGRTTFLITHRLSQIRWADQIVVLRKGVIAAIGAHDDLLRTSDAYRRIFATYEGSEDKMPDPESVPRQVPGND
jgi:ATP-binding cassette subfamily B protein